MRDKAHYRAANTRAQTAVFTAIFSRNPPNGAVVVAERGMRCMEARLPSARVEATKVIILSPGLARPGAQVQVPANQLGQAEIQGQGGWQDQPSIGHQAVVVKGGVDAVGVDAW